MTSLMEQLRDEIVEWALKKKKAIEDREHWQINPANFGTLRTLDELLVYLDYQSSAPTARIDENG